MTPSLNEARRLQADLSEFYRRAESAAAERLKPFNEAILRLGRLLVPISFTRDGAFRHDPAVNIPPLPDLAPVQELPKLAPSTDAYGITRAHLVRGQNRLVVTLREARRLVQSVH